MYYLDAEGRISFVPAVKAGFIPLDKQLELWDGHWSEGVVRVKL